MISNKTKRFSFPCAGVGMQFRRASVTGFKFDEFNGLSPFLHFNGETVFH